MNVNVLSQVAVAGKSSATTLVAEVMRPKSLLVTLRPSDSVLHAMQVRIVDQ